MLKEKEKHRLSKLSELIFMASREVKVLRHITWPEEVRINFFKNNSKKIPNVSYPKYNDSDLNSILDDAEQLFGDTKFDDWLRKKVLEIKKSSNLLNACGTKDFLKFLLISTGSLQRKSMTKPLSPEIYQISLKK